MFCRVTDIPDPWKSEMLKLEKLQFVMEIVPSWNNNPLPSVDPKAEKRELRIDSEELSEKCPSIPCNCEVYYLHHRHKTAQKACFRPHFPYIRVYEADIAVHS